MNNEDFTNDDKSMLQECWDSAVCEVERTIEQLMTQPDFNTKAGYKIGIEHMNAMTRFTLLSYAVLIGAPLIYVQCTNCGAGVGLLPAGTNVQCNNCDYIGKVLAVTQSDLVQ